MKRFIRFFTFVVLALVSMSVARAEEDPTVYVTKTGKKYHAAGCSYLKKSSIPMKLSVASQLYSPCSKCKPPGFSSVAKPSVGKPVGVTPQGDTIYEGPQGGRYHYDTSGKKVYLPKKPDSVYVPKQSVDKAVGTTAEGDTIYEGPRGGRYYYSNTGKKIYLPKKPK